MIRGSSSLRRAANPDPAARLVRAAVKLDLAALRSIEPWLAHRRLGRRMFGGVGLAGDVRFAFAMSRE